MDRQMVQAWAYFRRLAEMASTTAMPRNTADVEVGRDALVRVLEWAAKRPEHLSAFLYVVSLYVSASERAAEKLAEDVRAATLEGDGEDVGIPGEFLDATLRLVQDLVDREFGSPDAA